MKQGLHSLKAIKQMIEDGQFLVLSGDESLLRQLPPGNWIGGTIPYFLDTDGGKFAKDMIFASSASDVMADAVIRTYDQSTIANVFKDIPQNGFGLIMIPAKCRTHFDFAIGAPDYEAFGQPLIGWISGVGLDDLGKVTPKVFNGQTAQVAEDGAVVMHVRLPENKVPDIDIVNIFEQGDGDTIIFPEDGFSVGEAFVNGRKVNFAEYVTKRQLDLRLPLVADYCGAMINVSFQKVDAESKVVSFYAPVFKGVAYRYAKGIDDYLARFTETLPKDGLDHIFFSCNCILNYLFSELEGKRTGRIIGPVTFGEIAYLLLNQTAVYLNIQERSR